MLPVLRATWSLFLGIGLIMLCNGLLVTLLGVRATLEQFPTTVTGIIMTAYYVGFLVGSRLVPRLVRGVGHVRVFAALASLASSSVLVHSVFVDPWVWTALRLLTGFSYAGLYVVVESWLNERATNTTRGQLLSIYMLVSIGGFGGGQFLLNLGSPQGQNLFILAAVLVSFALVPISLTPIQTPLFAQAESIGLRRLYHSSPLGLIGMIGTGMGNGMLLGMGAVYAAALGMSLSQITGFMAATQIGALLLQWPVGRLSDRFDRRLVLTLVTFLAAVMALLVIPVQSGRGWPLLLLIGLFGGLNLPMYSLCIAHTNDHLNPRQMIAASGTLVMANGLGASFGPLAGSLLMQALGPAGFLLGLALTHTGIGVFALYRISRRASPLEQGVFVAVDPQSASVAVALVAEEQLEQEVARQEAGQS